MTESVTTPWQGDWQSRLTFKLDELGYTSLEQYLEDHPGLSYLKLADLLQDANVAALQLYGEHIRRATEQGQLRRVALDSLARFLAEHIKRGWNNGRHFPFRLASAFGDWKVALRQFAPDSKEVHDGRLDLITNAIRSSNPPNGWIPESGKDEILIRAFEEAWPPGS